MKGEISKNDLFKKFFLKNKNLRLKKKKKMLKTKHAGIIPFTVDENGELVFLLGIDSRSKDLADFGGKRETNENAFQTAFREFKEETLDIFNSKVYNNMESLYETISDKSENTIIFLPIDRKWLKRAIIRFSEKKKLIEKNKIVEMSCIKWIYLNNFVKKLSCKPNKQFKAFRKDPLWESLRLFLINICNKFFFEKLEELYYSSQINLDNHTLKNFKKESQTNLTNSLEGVFLQI